MNILLDECVPRPLRKLLANHTCRNAQEMGWKSVKNGELLTLAEAQFDLFITSDQGLAYQENLRGRRIAILELSTNTSTDRSRGSAITRRPSRKYRAPNSVASKSLSEANFWVARSSCAMRLCANSNRKSHSYLTRAQGLGRWRTCCYT